MTQSKSKIKLLKKIGRITFIIVSLFLIITTLVHIIWKNSGNNEWKLKIDKDGTQVYSMKIPGNNMVLLKGVTTWNYSLSQCVAPFFDKSIQDDPSKWIPMCTYYNVIEENYYKGFQTNLQLYRWNMPGPFKPREILVLGNVKQDSVTKVITLENIAVPNAIPPTKGYVRTAHHHNVWKFTPKTDGSVRIEFIMDMNLGGFFPEMPINFKGKDQVFEILNVAYPKLMKKYVEENTKFDFIHELEKNTTPVSE